MSNIVAIVKILLDQVFAVSLDGLKRQIFEGERLLMGEPVLIGLAGEVTLRLANGEVINLSQNSKWQAAPTDSPQIVNSLIAGADPIIKVDHS